MQTIEADETGAAADVDDDIAHEIAALADTDLLRLQAIARFGLAAFPVVEWPTSSTNPSSAC